MRRPERGGGPDDAPAAPPRGYHPINYRGRPTVPRYQFPGYPAFLEAAAAEIGRPESAGPARTATTLAAMATLCAQAADADAGHVVGILAEAEALGDQLRAAQRASELMLAHVRSGRIAPEAVVSSDPAGRARSAPAPTRPRGASRNHG